jgi:hypothetical protein
LTFDEYSATHFTNADEEQLSSRLKLRGLAENRLDFRDSFFRDLPLFTHSGITARSLAIQELYLEARSLPGLFLDFGTWKGSNLVLLENYRAIYDTFDTQRKIVGFDTFSGYEGFDQNESTDPTIQNSTYSLPSGYGAFLKDLINHHERANGKNRSIHEVVEGDATEELPNFLLKNPGFPVALAIFDMNAFEPTYKCLEMISPRIISGSILAFWQFSRPEITGERRAFEAIRGSLPDFNMQKSKTYPSLTFARFT